MNNLHLKQLEIINRLPYLSVEKIDEILNYIDRLLCGRSEKDKQIKSVWGLWKNSDIDISHIEKELVSIRKKTEINILKKI
ncbi:MAG: hypothetical protein HY738_22395 [Bacteroidia bacterium]|nr:hypothetical protein [Bacteroidia bacterium]